MFRDFSGAIGGNGGTITKSDAGTVIFSGNNTYTAGTTITAAHAGRQWRGLPTTSLLTLNGGVLQSNSATTFTA